MADISGEGGISAPATEQNVDIAQVQARTTIPIELLSPPITGDFVASINGLTGLIIFTNGANISITSDGVSNFTFSVTGLQALATAKCNIAAAPPTPGNDESEGYVPFSMWQDNTIPATPDFYICAANTTAAAVWVKLT